VRDQTDFLFYTTNHNCHEKQIDSTGEATISRIVIFCPVFRWCFLRDEAAEQHK
jgi:hypothetical protein